MSMPSSSSNGNNNINANPTKPIVGKDGRIEVRAGVQIREVAKAFELLHADEDIDSEEKLAQMLQSQ